jgi:hypothetical protein
MATRPSRTDLVILARVENCERMVRGLADLLAGNRLRWDKYGDPPQWVVIAAAERRVDHG